MAKLFEERQFLDNNGDPLAGGKVHSFEGGTSTPKVTYTAQDGLTPNANPLILSSAGRGDIWLATDKLYKLRLDNSSDTTIWTLDNVGQIGAGGIATGMTIVENTIVVNASNNQWQLDAAALAPIDSALLSVTSHIKTSFGTTNGLTAIDIGDSSNETLWGHNLPVTNPNETNGRDWLAYAPRNMTASYTALITAIGGPFDATGVINITSHYLTFAPSTA